MLGFEDLIKFTVSNGTNAWHNIDCDNVENKQAIFSLRKFKDEKITSMVCSKVKCSHRNKVYDMVLNVLLRYPRTEKKTKKLLEV